MNTHSSADFAHKTAPSIGVLLSNLGTPDSPKTSDVRKYLKEFLWDHRVVEVPRPIWWFILNAVILNTRPRKSAKAYKKVWTKNGSPLMSISMDQLRGIKAQFNSGDDSVDFSGEHFEDSSGKMPSIHFEFSMRYGNPSIESGLSALRDKGVNRILILPLYPQYSATTTASTFDEVTRVISKWRRIPELRFINHYHDDENYINALAARINIHWQEHGKAEHLLMSFHGIPQDYFDSGDPYHCECHKTARLLAEKLGLSDDRWTLSFQSRLGPKQWLKPYTDETLKAMPSKGIKNIQVVCPGFSADCLETIEEIAMENRDIFIESGGEVYEYIPCLNDSAEHLFALESLIRKHVQGWEDRAISQQQINMTKQRAKSLMQPWT
ncbi:MAG: ferrochelatase [Gammaproteobacteria bacterium]|nr:ferrochelatase [Gammaproteobacteria bacterium]